MATLTEEKKNQNQKEEKKHVILHDSFSPLEGGKKKEPLKENK